ncbi:MAG: FAD binding domain-containing protein, partial [Desulfobacteraceae bacterium]
MREFQYKNINSFDEASKILLKKKSIAISGGTDLITVLKDEIFEDAFESVVNLKTIDSAAYITAEEDCFKIGALTKLADVADSPTVQKRMPILSEAAKSVASPIIRNSATVGGNICQDVRCTYYRSPHQSGGRINCYRKGGNECFALHGNNKYHS